jgi:hypothetical protein
MACRAPPRAKLKPRCQHPDPNEFSTLNNKHTRSDSTLVLYTSAGHNLNFKGTEATRYRFDSTLVL